MYTDTPPWKTEKMYILILSHLFLITYSFFYKFYHFLVLQEVAIINLNDLLMFLFLKFAILHNTY